MNARPTFEDHPLRVLIGWSGSEPPYQTPLIARCEPALALPLKDQTVETIRLLLGQGIAVDVLLPRALEILELNILASGDMYDGDLLSACQRLPASYWSDHPEHWTELENIHRDFDRKIDQVNKDRAVFMARNPFGARL
ncbi:contact-dependent growth inhibition system immunity protein [Mesorhizobium sp. CAU 1732]|uniref:contact-dependent growth inhibition system immunity protein n=1 Tax=Mesorhizobium sp. CAU 1732 TaxID=3140358 RepID=UPI00325FF216